MTPQDPDRPGTTRREFLRRSLLAAAAPLAAAMVRPAMAAGWLAPAGAAGTASIDVRDKGARGDGKTDDTSAFQAAIAALPAAGGTVTVPAGNYMIDASRAVNLRSNMHLKMAPDAQLTAIPNGLKRYHVIKVWRVSNVQITGGRIVGEREGHTGSGGEWGYGLNIQGSHHVQVSDIHVSDCWGDGVWIGALGKGAGVLVSTDVTLDRVVSTNNRRQGMSIGPVDGVRILNSTFSGTHGTAPQAGIDLEPMSQGPTRDVLIEGCLITGNKGTGIECHRNVSGLVVRKCTIKENAGYGVLGVNTSDLWIDGNTIVDNGLAGVALGKRTHDAKVTGNTLSANSNRYIHHLLKSIASPGGGGKHTGQLKIGAKTSNIQISGNQFGS